MNIALAFQKTAVTAALASLSCASMAGFVVTIEAPGAVNTTATFKPNPNDIGVAVKGVETFNGRALQNNQNFSSTFGGANHGITGAYSGVNVILTDQFGGSGW